MKNKLNSVVIASVLVLLFMFTTGCDPEINTVKDTDTGREVVTKNSCNFWSEKYGDHYYVMARGMGYFSGITHHPDCPCNTPKK